MLIILTENLKGKKAAVFLLAENRKWRVSAGGGKLLFITYRTVMLQCLII